MTTTNFTQESFRTIRELQILLQKLSDPIMQKYHLTFLQINILLELSESHVLRTDQLSSIFGLRRPNIASIMRKLLSRGLIERFRCKGKRHIYQFRLSLDGKQIISQIEEDFSDIFFSFMSSMPRDIFEAVISGIYAIRLFIRGLVGQNAYLLPDTKLDISSDMIDEKYLSQHENKFKNSLQNMLDDIASNTIGDIENENEKDRDTNNNIDKQDKQKKRLLPSSSQSNGSDC